LQKKLLLNWKQNSEEKPSKTQEDENSGIPALFQGKEAKGEREGNRFFTPKKKESATKTTRAPPIRVGIREGKGTNERCEEECLGGRFSRV